MREAKRHSTSGRGKAALTPKKKFGTNLPNAIRRAVIATPPVAGVACVDLDSVILFHKHGEDSHLGRVLRRGRELVKLLQHLHFRVIVLTSRPARRQQEILSYLASHGVWVERVTNRKPYADIYCDDKALRIPKNWQ